MTKSVTTKVKKGAQARVAVRDVVTCELDAPRALAAGSAPPPYERRREESESATLTLNRTEQSLGDCIVILNE